MATTHVTLTLSLYTCSSPCSLRIRRVHCRKNDSTSRVMSVPTAPHINRSVTLEDTSPTSRMVVKPKDSYRRTSIYSSAHVVRVVRGC